MKTSVVHSDSNFLTRFLKKRLKTEQKVYLAYGVLFGLLFPVLGTLWDCLWRFGTVGWNEIVQSQTQVPTLWIIDLAPLILGIVSSFAGRAAPNLSELVPASMIQQPSNSGAEADTITNEELLREDKEFEEELRRKRERNDRSGSRPQQKGRDNRGRDGRPRDNRPPQNRNQGQNRNDNRRPNPENRPPRPEGTGTPADRQNTGGQNNRNPRHNRNRSRDQRDFKGKGNQGNTPPTDKPQG